MRSSHKDNALARIARGELWRIAPWARYLGALGLAIAALVLRLAMGPLTGFILVTFYPAVLVSALLFGAGPGLVTTAAGIAGTAYLLSAGTGVHLDALHIAVPMIVFALCGALVCRLTASLHRSVAALHSNERILRSLFEASRVGIVLTDAQGRFVESNEAFRKMVGYSAEELRRLDYWSLTPKQHLTESRRQLETLRNTGQFGPYEKEYLRRDGSLVPVQLNGAMFTAADGAAYSWAIIEDIGARARANELIARLVREQSTVVENRLIGIVRVQERRITWCNATFAAMFGYAPHELVGQPSRILYPDDATHARFRDENFPVIESGGIVRTEIRQQRKDGSIGWFEISCALLSPDSREQIGVFVDITARRDAVAALALSEERLRRTFDSMAEGLLLLDPGGAAIEANPAACRILGMTREQLLGRAPPGAELELVRADGSPWPREELPSMITLRTGEAQEKRIMGVRAPGGAQRWISVNSRPIRGADPERPLEGAVVTFVDITELQQVSEDLRQARGDLESILHTVPARITAWNRDYTNRFINDRAALSFGMTPGQGRGLHAREVLGEQRFARAKPYTDAALAGLRQSRLQSEPQPDGSVRHSQIEYLPRSVDGKVDGFYVLATDVTELWRSQERISELAQRLAASHEDERRTAAITLHEGIAQDLFAAKLALAHLESQTRGRAGVTQAFHELTAAIENCIGSIRQIADTLRPSSLSHLSLADSLGDYARKFSERTQLQIAVMETTPVPALEESTRIAFFRATQEALDNVRRHARATRVTIELSADAELVTVRIIDDGIGIDPQARDKAGSLGLLEIRERLIGLGGGMRAEGNRPTGTTITMFLPHAQPLRAPRNADVVGPPGGAGGSVRTGAL
jgi:PAS domain S-box-containing protein